MSFFFLTCIFHSLFLFLFSLVLFFRWYFSFFDFSLRSLKRTKASPAVGDAVDTHSISPLADRASPLLLPLSYWTFRQIHQFVFPRYFVISLHMYAMQRYINRRHSQLVSLSIVVILLKKNRERIRDISLSSKKSRKVGRICVNCNNVNFQDL